MSENEKWELHDRLLLSILPHVVFDGWSAKAIESGKKEFNNQTLDCGLTFPDNADDLAIHFGNFIDRKMLVELSKIELQEKPVRERIFLSLEARIDLLEPYKEQIRRLLAFLALPQNHILGIRMTYNAVNSIWYNAGDTSTDFNFYSKRVLLAGIYSSAILYWLSDGSANCYETKDYIKRCIDQVMLIPKYKTKLAKRLTNLFTLR